MIFAFLDDTNKGDWGWHARGGLMIEGAHLLSLETDFLNILQGYDIPVDDPDIDTEIKWSLGPGNWIRDNIFDPDRLELHRELLSLIDRYEARVLTSAFHYQRITDWNLETAKQQSFVHTFERIHTYADRLNLPVVIVCDNEDDSRRTKDRVQETFHLVQGGSPYINLNKIYRHAWAVDSKYHAGIQLADLVVGITMCMIAGHTTWAETRWPMLRGRFMLLEELNTPQRYGISIMPTWHYPNFLSRCNPYVRL